MFFNKKDVYITTDSEKVKKRFKKITKNIILTKNYCLNGTERCSFAINKIKKKYKYFIITSCDMPFLNVRILIFLIKKIEIIKNNNIDGITVHTKIKDTNILRNKNIAKIILKKNQVIDFKRIMKLEKYRKNTIFFHIMGLLFLKEMCLKNIKNYQTLRGNLKKIMNGLN
jgi:CMP-2-keto-3-deoxyoctulosonic acid synthetase